VPFFSIYHLIGPSSQALSLRRLFSCTFPSCLSFSDVFLVFAILVVFSVSAELLMSLFREFWLMERHDGVSEWDTKGIYYLFAEGSVFSAPLSLQDHYGDQLLAKNTSLRLILLSFVRSSDRKGGRVFLARSNNPIQLH